MDVGVIIQLAPASNCPVSGDWLVMFFLSHVDPIQESPTYYVSFSLSLRFHSYGCDVSRVTSGIPVLDPPRLPGTVRRSQPQNSASKPPRDNIMPRS